MNNNNSKAYKVAMTGLFAALSYVVFTFFQIKVTLPGGDATSFHLGNAVVVLGALFLGGPLGGLAGAIGMSIGDLLDPVYIFYVPKTFLLKLCIGLITGFIAHKIGKVSTCSDYKKVIKWSLIAAIAGLTFNAVFDPLVGYYYKILFLGKPAAELTLAWNITTCTFNAVTSTIVSVFLYNILRPALRATGLLPSIGKSPKKANTTNPKVA